MACSRLGVGKRMDRKQTGELIEIWEFHVCPMWLPESHISKAAVASDRTASSGNTGRQARSGNESRAHYARDSSGQLRGILNLVNRAIGRGFIRAQRDGCDRASRGKRRVFARHDGSVETDTAATTRSRGRIVLVAAIRRFGLLGLIATRKDSDFLGKTQHRLRKKDEQGAKAQCEKSIFAN